MLQNDFAAFDCHKALIFQAFYGANGGFCSQAGHLGDVLAARVDFNTGGARLLFGELEQYRADAVLR